MLQFEGQTILIIDDQPNNLQVISDTLAAANLQVAVALDGESALEQIQHFQPDLILMDVMMPPGIDGFETCRRILENPKTKEVPVIFMTALSDVDYKTQAFEVGAVDYITKPFQQAEVFARIRAHLRLHTITQLLEERNHQLQQEKERAERANRIKTEFLANMSHELRTPLNGVMGYAQGLQMSENLDSTEKRWVDSIYQCGSHLLTLINDILDISKIEAQKLELLPNNIVLTAFLRQIIELFQQRVQETQLELIVELDPNLPHMIHADEKRLRQVLLNLLSNAFKFTEQGAVTLSVSSLLPDHPSNGADPDAPAYRLLFQVIDTGIGIPPENQQKIFEPFEQAHNSLHYSQGTGLGLSISQRIVQLMGSQLMLQSSPGEGSCFSFELAVDGDCQRSSLVKPSH